MLFPSYQRGSLATPDGASMEYVRLGSGRIPILHIPGGGDGVATISAAPRALAWLYHGRAQEYRTLLVRRRDPLPAGHGMEQHADDFLRLMEQLQWGPTIIECSSTGGPIGQWMAAKRPELVRGLILSCSLHRANDHLRAIVREWLELIRQRRWWEFHWSTLVHTYRPRTVARYRALRPLLGLVKVRSPERLERLLEALLELDNSAALPRIACPTLVIGGEDDAIVDAALQREMASLIPDCRLQLYRGYGHGNDVENPDHPIQVDRFVREIWATDGRQVPAGAVARG